MEEVNIHVQDIIPHEPKSAAETQSFLEDWLSSQNKQSKELHFPPLSGNIHLGVLEQNGFNNLTGLFFPKGNIQQLHAIPQTVEILDVRHNKIEHLHSLPDNLTHLYASHNALIETDIVDCESLVLLDVGHNYLTKIGTLGYDVQLPGSLETLICSYNRLKKLDLYSTKQLKELHCDHNPELKLYHVPDTVIQGTYETVVIHPKPKEQLDYVQLSDEYNAQVKEFMRLKTLVEQRQNTNTRVANDSLIGEIQTLIQYKKKFPLHGKLKIKQPPMKDRVKCMGCGGKNGMTFKITKQAYHAYCNNDPPCDWKILIHRAFYENRETIIYEYLDFLEELKDQLIQAKMDSIFGYLDDAYAKNAFEKRMKLFEFYSSNLKVLQDTEEDLYHNTQKQEEIYRKQTEIQEKLEEIKTILSTSAEIDGRSPQKEVARIQLEEIFPAAQFIQKKLYERMMMYCIDEKASLYKLDAHIALPQSQETLLEGESRVEHFGKKAFSNPPSTSSTQEKNPSRSLSRKKKSVSTNKSSLMSDSSMEKWLGDANQNSQESSVSPA